jgi:hypothetical protein
MHHIWILAFLAITCGGHIDLASHLYQTLCQLSPGHAKGEGLALHALERAAITSPVAPAPIMPGYSRPADCAASRIARAGAGLALAAAARAPGWTGCIHNGASPSITIKPLLLLTCCATGRCVAVVPVEKHL